MSANYADSLILFTLPNGAEVIGGIKTNTDTVVTVSHPLVIRPIQKSPGQYALDLFPHSLANPEGDHQFTWSQILSRSLHIPDMLQKAYTERTSSIILASALDDIEKMGR